MLWPQVGATADRAKGTAPAKAAAPAPASAERHFKNIKQLTFGRQNAEAYFSFSGNKLIFQSTNNWMKDTYAATQPLGHRLVFVNGRYRPELSSVGALPGGAFLGSLAAAPALALAEARLGQLAQPEGHALAALNAAALADGALVHLPEGTVVPEPIEILHLTVGGGAPAASHPRNLIVAERGSQITVIENYVSLTEAPA